ncbi:MAG: SAM-dependent methyltransferase, partial [Microcystaceae cyanobacterium]
NDADLLTAKAQPHPCLTGWPSRSLFNYDYHPIDLTENQFIFMQTCEQNPTFTVGQVLATLNFSLEEVRSLQKQQLIMLKSF